MKILIIYCHPSQHSYTHEVLTKLMSVLNTQGIIVTLSDLYAINFQSYSVDKWNEKHLAKPVAKKNDA